MADEEEDAVFHVDLDEAWIDSMFGRLGDMQCDLDADPLRYGPKRLSAKLSETRKYLSSTENIYLEISKKLRRLSKERRRAASEFDMRRDDLLSHDPEVRAGRSVSDRDAIVNVKLRDIVEHMARIDLAIQDLEHVEKVVKSKRADLRDTQNRIRDQIKLCQEEIGLGGSWGSALPPGKRPALSHPHPAKISPSMDDLDDLLEGDEMHLDSDASEEEEAPSKTPEVLSKTPGAPESPESPEASESPKAVDVDLDVETVTLAVPENVRDFDEVASSSSMADVDSFLEEAEALNPAKPAAKQPDIDLDDLLDDLADL